MRSGSEQESMRDSSLWFSWSEQVPRQSILAENKCTGRSGQMCPRDPLERNGNFGHKLASLDILQRDPNPSTQERDQLQISPAASPEVLHHTVWRTWLFIAYSDGKRLHYQVPLHHFTHFSSGWENVLFELGSQRVKVW